MGSSPTTGTTLSCADLTKLSSLLEAYESFGQEALVAAAESPGFFAELARLAAQTENCGGNPRKQGYTNMVDLGHLARKTAWLLPSAQSVCDALADCVVFRIGGPLPFRGHRPELLLLLQRRP